MKSISRKATETEALTDMNEVIGLYLDTLNFKNSKNRFLKVNRKNGENFIIISEKDWLNQFPGLIESTHQADRELAKESNDSDIIDELLQSPLKISDFRPLKREEIYARS